MRVGALSADSGGVSAVSDALLVVGTWHNQTDAPAASGTDSGRCLEHRRRPVTRSQSSDSAADAQSAAKRSAAQIATAKELRSADAVFSITAHAPPDGNAQWQAAPAISVCHSDGAPAPSGTRLKVILYPLPRPGHGYLALRWPIIPDAGPAGDAITGAAPRPSIVARTDACGGATAAGDSVPEAPSTEASGGQRAEHGSGGALQPTAAPWTRLEKVIKYMNRAAHALAALKGELRTQGSARHSAYVDIVLNILCTAAVGAGDTTHLQPKAGDDLPRGAGQRLLRHALRGSALLQDVARRYAMLRKGAVPMLCIACAVSVLTVPKLSCKSRLIMVGCNRQAGPSSRLSSSLLITLPWRQPRVAAAADLYVPRLHSAGSAAHQRHPAPDAAEQQRAVVAVRQAALAGGISHLVGCVCGAYLLRRRAVTAALLTAGGTAFADWTGPLVRLSTVRIPCCARQNARAAPEKSRLMLSLRTHHTCVCRFTAWSRHRAIGPDPHVTV